MDLARIDGSLVCYLSIVVVVRETSGAFDDESLVNVLMFLLVGTMINKQALSDKEIFFEYATFLKSAGKKLPNNSEKCLCAKHETKLQRKSVVKF
jgi:hypothetical protein